MSPLPQEVPLWVTAIAAVAVGGVAFAVGRGQGGAARDTRQIEGDGDEGRGRAADEQRPPPGLVPLTTGLAPRASRPTVEQAAPSHLRRDIRAQVELTEVAADQAVLAWYLADVRDLLGADEAVYWCWAEERDAIRPWAWSTAGADRPLHFRMDEWGALVRWSAQERLVQVAGAGAGTSTIGVAPVAIGERLHGVLSVTAAHEMGGGDDRGTLKRWLSRHADHVARLVDLCEVRRGYGRTMRQGQALLRAAERIRSHKTRGGLAQALCETALEVTSAGGAALVRWSPLSGRGDVQFATSGLGVRAGFGVVAESIVARACQEALPVVLEDAAPLRTGALFGPGDHFTGAGSAAVVPIVREDSCIGAVVVTAAMPGAIAHDEARNVSLLGAVAAPSLESVWEIEEVDRRSRIDGLTGLANRRQFDEQLQRVLAETDRFGGAGSLVLVDIDRFKSVNDTYGHEAGDQVLRQVARALAEGVRTVDVVARYGGEELAILLPQTSVAGAHELAERLRQRIAGRPVRVAGQEIGVTASFGVASYPEVVADRNGLVAAADRALYAAKREGRNCVRSAVPTGRGSAT